MADNVKVAVRCRPFNSREINMDSKAIIQVRLVWWWERSIGHRIQIRVGMGVHSTAVFKAVLFQRHKLPWAFPAGAE